MLIWKETSLFEKGEKMKEIRTREYVLSYPDTVKRYEILKQRVENNI